MESSLLVSLKFLEKFQWLRWCTTSVTSEKSVVSYWSLLLIWSINLFKRILGDLNPENLDILASRTFTLTFSWMIDCSSVGLIVYGLKLVRFPDISLDFGSGALLFFHLLVYNGLAILHFKSFNLVGLLIFLSFNANDGSLESFRGINFLSFLKFNFFHLYSFFRQIGLIVLACTSPTPCWGVGGYMLKMFAPTPTWTKKCY